MSTGIPQRGTPVGTEVLLLESVWVADSDRPVVAGQVVQVPAGSAGPDEGPDRAGGLLVVGAGGHRDTRIQVGQALVEVNLSTGGG